MKEKEIIFKAIESIGSEYFTINTINGKKVRERVFCYELYHQMRKLQENLKIQVSTIHGEIDKRGNSKFNSRDRKNPDFVFHLPGSMNANSIVVEVKGKYLTEKIIKDFSTLNIFTKDYNYKLGVFLIYNYSFNQLKSNITRNITKFETFKDNNKIIILCKKSSKDELEIKTINDLFSTDNK